jgi:hypothetical protein
LSSHRSAQGSLQHTPFGQQFSTGQHCVPPQQVYPAAQQAPSQQRTPSGHLGSCQQLPNVQPSVVHGFPSSQSMHSGEHGSGLPQHGSPGMQQGSGLPQQLLPDQERLHPPSTLLEVRET